MMASQSEKASTYQLPSGQDTSFLGTTYPDWAKIDVIGQTIIFAELESHFGSFENTCSALNLQSNEVQSFVLAHFQNQRACKQGSSVAKQLGQDQAASAIENNDVPQQRPVLISPSSTEPACDFLKAMGYHDLVPAIQAWTGKTTTWPPHIDITGLDFGRLDQADVTFTSPQEPRRYSRYTSALRNDTRAMVAFVGAWKPKEDGSPDTRISFVDVPEGSVARGPHGPRRLEIAGRYYVCWPADSRANHEYNDFVLARNTHDIREDGNDQLQSANSGAYRNDSLGVLETNQKPLMAYTGSSVNPKDVFGTQGPDAFGIEQNAAPFHSQTEPQGPVRMLANPLLQQTWDTWPGEIFQFRLPPCYSLLGPLGNVLTFDPPQHERYDDLGNPQGLGGTYYIVPPLNPFRKTTFEMDDLPAHVALRVKTSQRMVIIRNGLVLPRFVEPGVHEWSIREGFLDCYGAHGCYDVYRTEGCYSILSAFTGNSHGQETNHEHGHGNGQDNEHHDEYMGHSRNVATDPSPNGEALKEIEDHERIDAYDARDTASRDILVDEQESRMRELYARYVRERERLDAIAVRDIAAIKRTQNGEVKKQSSYNQSNPTPMNVPPPNPQPGGTRQQQQQQKQPRDSNVITKPGVATRGKALLGQGSGSGVTNRKDMRNGEDEEYSLARLRLSRTEKPTTISKAPCPSKAQEKASNTPRGAGDPKSTPMYQPRQTRQPRGEVTTKASGAGRVSTRTPQLPSETAKTRQTRAGVTRKPIGPLLDSIRANNRSDDTMLRAPGSSQQTTRKPVSGAVNKKATSVTSTRVLRPRAAKAPLRSDQAKNEEEEE